MISRRRTNRIKPFQPYRPRHRTLGIVVAALIGFTLTFTAWGQQSARFDKLASFPIDGRSDLDLVVVESNAGPVTIGADEQTMVRASSSWLIRRPAVAAFRSEKVSSDKPISPRRQFEVTANCASWFPCRTSLVIDLVAGQTLQVRSAGLLSVDRFDGTAILEATGDKPILLGSTAGSLEIRGGSGGIMGFGIASHDVYVDSIGGPVELFFVESPTSLKIVAGDQPIVVSVPRGDYALTLNGRIPTTSTLDGVSIDRDIFQVAEASNKIDLQSSGSVVLRVANSGK